MAAASSLSPSGDRPPMATALPSNSYSTANTVRRTMYVCDLCDLTRPTHKRNNIEQHVLSHHITKAVKYRAEQHKRVVAPFVRRVMVEPGSTSTTGNQMSTAPVTIVLPAPAHSNHDQRSPVSVQRSPNSTTSSQHNNNHVTYSPYSSDGQPTRSAAYTSYRSNSLAIGTDMSQLMICSPETEHRPLEQSNNNSSSSTGYYNVQHNQHHQPQRAHAFHQGVFDASSAVRMSSNNESRLDRHPQHTAFHPSRPRSNSLPYGRHTNRNSSFGLPQQANSFSSSIDFDRSPQQQQQLSYETALRTTSVPCTGRGGSSAFDHFMEGRQQEPEYGEDAGNASVWQDLSRQNRNTQHNICALLTAVEYERCRNGKDNLSVMAECSKEDLLGESSSSETAYSPRAQRQAEHSAPTNSSNNNNNNNGEDVPISVVQMEFTPAVSSSVHRATTSQQQLGNAFAQSAATPPVTVGSREDLLIWRPF